MHYSVVLVTVTDPTWLETYIPAVQALVEKHGGNIWRVPRRSSAWKAKGPTRAPSS